MDKGVVSFRQNALLRRGLSLQFLPITRDSRGTVARLACEVETHGVGNAKCWKRRVLECCCTPALWAPSYCLPLVHRFWCPRCWPPVAARDSSGTGSGPGAGPGYSAGSGTGPGRGSALGSAVGSGLGHDPGWLPRRASALSVCAQKQTTAPERPATPARRAGAKRHLRGWRGTYKRDSSTPAHEQAARAGVESQ